MAIIPTKRNSALPVDALPTIDIATDMLMALRGSEQISAWCQSFYSQPPNLTMGVDPDDLPEESIYPLIDLDPFDGGDRGRGAERHSRIIVLSCGVIDRGKEPLVYPEITALTGIRQVAELATMVLETIGEVDLRGGYIHRADVRRVEEILFPFFFVEVEIEIRKPI